MKTIDNTYETRTIEKYKSICYFRTCSFEYAASSELYRLIHFDKRFSIFGIFDTKIGISCIHLINNLVFNTHHMHLKIEELNSHFYMIKTQCNLF